MLVLVSFATKFEASSCCFNVIFSACNSYSSVVCAFRSFKECKWDMCGTEKMKAKGGEVPVIVCFSMFPFCMLTFLGESASLFHSFHRVVALLGSYL